MTFPVIHTADKVKPGGVPANTDMEATPPSVDVQGFKMYLNPSDRVICEELRLYQVWEPFETAVLMSAVRRGQVVIDVGANIGYYTLLLSRAVGPEGRVFAFEPAPESAALLERNVVVNACGNVTVVQKAVSQATGPVQLFLAEENKGDHRIYDPGSGRRSLSVDSIRLDDYFAGYDGPLDWVKMDIQGAEAAAIEGMLGLFARNRKIRVITEFWPHGLVRAGVTPLQFLNHLCSLDFLIYKIDEETESVEPADTEQLLREYPSDSERFTNLLCTREPYGPAPVVATAGWRVRVREAEQEIAMIVPPGESYILIDGDEWGTEEGFAGRRRIPFLERDGTYWGPPPDVDTAVAELDRLRHAGAAFMVFAWPAFWWFDYYREFLQYVCATTTCVRQDDRLVVFDLRR